jgi:hypothetical protein
MCNITQSLTNVERCRHDGQVGSVRHKSESDIWHRTGNVWDQIGNVWDRTDDVQIRRKEEIDVGTAIPKPLSAAV